MHKFETVVRAGAERERLTTAFYRFIELHASSAQDQADMRTEMVGDLERRTVYLWSEEAVVQFERYLATVRLEPPEGLARVRSFGTRRFDDLP